MRETHGGRRNALVLLLENTGFTQLYSPDTQRRPRARRPAPAKGGGAGEGRPRRRAGPHRNPGQQIGRRSRPMGEGLVCGGGGVGCGSVVWVGIRRGLGGGAGPREGVWRAGSGGGRRGRRRLWPPPCGKGAHGGGHGRGLAEDGGAPREGCSGSGGCFCSFGLLSLEAGGF